MRLIAPQTTDRAGTVERSVARCLIMVLAGVATLFPAVTSAQCMTFDKPEELFARADAVFVGTVVATKPTGERGDHAIVDIATFRVERTWKGRLNREIRVGADRSFERGTKYVVFAAGKPLSTSILCKWAEPEHRAKTKLEWLAKRRGRGARFEPS
jgi:hypothetical protein